MYSVLYVCMPQGLKVFQRHRLVDKATWNTQLMLYPLTCKLITPYILPYSSI